MVKRFVVRAASPAAPNKSAVGNLVGRTASYPLMLVLLIVPSFAATAAYYSNGFGVFNGSAVGTVVVALASILVGTISLFAFGNKNSSSSSSLDDETHQEVSVSIYSSGVQIGGAKTEFRSMQSIFASSSSRNTRCGPPFPVYLPRESVLDCVVSEVLFAHKVSSVVVFRVVAHKNTKGPRAASQSEETTESNVYLVPAFPGVDMTYDECVTMKNKINECLHKE